MKKNIPLKPINTTEPQFNNREEFLKWRKKVLENYEQSIISYQKEMHLLFGHTEE